MENGQKAQFFDGREWRDITENTVLALTYSDKFKDYYIIGIYLDIEKAKAKAEEHWQSMSRGVPLVEWYKSNGGDTNATPNVREPLDSPTWDKFQDWMHYVCYSIKTFEVE